MLAAKRTLPQKTNPNHILPHVSECSIRPPRIRAIPVGVSVVPLNSITLRVGKAMRVYKCYLKWVGRFK